MRWIFALAVIAVVGAGVYYMKDQKVTNVLVDGTTRVDTRGVVIQTGSRGFNGLETSIEIRTADNQKQSVIINFSQDNNLSVPTRIAGIPQDEVTADSIQVGDTVRVRGVQYGYGGFIRAEEVWIEK